MSVRKEIVITANIVRIVLQRAADREDRRMENAVRDVSRVRMQKDVSGITEKDVKDATAVKAEKAEKVVPWKVVVREDSKMVNVVRVVTASAREIVRRAVSTDREEQEMANLPITDRTVEQDRTDMVLKVIKTSSRMIGAVAVTAKAAAVVLAVIVRAAEAMEDRRIAVDSQQLRVLRQKLRPRILRRSVRKKRDVSVRKRIREIVKI